jgi:hypothetical protein
MDPEKLRQQQLEDFLLGGAGHSTMGITLGSAGKAAVSRERQQDALKYGRMGELAKRGEDFIEKGRATREKGFEIGEKTAEQTEAAKRQGLASGSAMVDTDKRLADAGLDRASREKIAKMNADVQDRATAAQKEGTLQLRYESLLTTIDKNKNVAINDATKGSPDAVKLKTLSNFEAMGQLTKDQVAQKTAAQASLEAQVKAIENDAASQRDRIMSLVSKGTNLGGWKSFTEQKPTKK